MTVVNCLKEVCTHYCGRPGSFHQARGNPIDLSILGNPYWMKDESQRAWVIAKHRQDLHEWLKSDTPWRRAMVSLPEDAILGCWCAPKACHCDTLVRAHAWLKREYPELWR
jgi:hypothetical protein